MIDLFGYRIISKNDLKKFGKFFSLEKLYRCSYTYDGDRIINYIRTIDNVDVSVEKGQVFINYGLFGWNIRDSIIFNNDEFVDVLNRHGVNFFKELLFR